VVTGAEGIAADGAGGVGLAVAHMSAAGGALAVIMAVAQRLAAGGAGQMGVRLYAQTMVAGRAFAVVLTVAQRLVTVAATAVQFAVAQPLAAAFTYAVLTLAQSFSAVVAQSVIAAVAEMTATFGADGMVGVDGDAEVCAASVTESVRFAVTQPLAAVFTETVLTLAQSFSAIVAQSVIAAVTEMTAAFGANGVVGVNGDAKVRAASVTEAVFAFRKRLAASGAERGRFRSGGRGAGAVCRGGGGRVTGGQTQRQHKQEEKDADQCFLHA